MILFAFFAGTYFDRNRWITSKRSALETAVKSYFIDKVFQNVSQKLLRNTLTLVLNFMLNLKLWLKKKSILGVFL